MLGCEYEPRESPQSLKMILNKFLVKIRGMRNHYYTAGVFQKHQVGWHRSTRARYFCGLAGFFTVGEFETVGIDVVGLGFFKCYINGTLINPDTFLPLSSDYENSCDPADEVITLRLSR